MIDSIANVLVKLAAAMLIISLIDSDKMAQSLIGLGTAMGEVLAAVAVVGKTQDAGSMFSAGKAFQRIATGMIAIAIALKILSGIKPMEMATAIAGMGLVLIEMTLFLQDLSKIQTLDQGKSMAKIAKSLTSIGLAMILLGAAMKIIATMDWGSLAKGLVAIGAVLAEIAIFMIAVATYANDPSFNGTKIKSIGDSMIRMGLALVIIAAAMKIMASIDVTGMDLALTQMLAAFVGIGAFTVIVGKYVGGASFIAISAGMLVMSVALIALAGAFKALGNLKPQTVGNGLKVMAMGIAALAVAALVLGSLSSFFLLAAAGLAAFGIAVGIASAAMLEAIPVFGAFQVVGQGIGDVVLNVLGDALEMVILLIPQFVLSIVEAFIKVLGKVKDLLINLFDVLIDTAVELLPRVIALGVQILFSILEGIEENIGRIAELALQILGNFIEALGEGLPDFLDKVLGFVVDVINGVADSVRDNGGAIGAALGNLASAIVEGLLSGIFGFAGTFISGVADFIGDSINSVADWIMGGSGDVSGIKPPDNVGGKVIETTAQGMEDNAPKLRDTCEEVAEDSLDALDFSEDTPAISKNAVDGIVDYFKDESVRSEYWNTLYEFAGVGVDAMKARWDEHSPSRVAMKIGQYIVEGLSIGIEDETSEFENSIYNSGSSLINAIRTAVLNAQDILNDDLNPVITPVLDLSNVENGASQLSNLLGNKASYNAAISIGSRYRNAEIQNGDLTDQPIIMNNNFTLNGVGNIQDPSVLNNLADKLADKINTILGNAL